MPCAHGSCVVCLWEFSKSAASYETSFTALYIISMKISARHSTAARHHSSVRSCHTLPFTTKRQSRHAHAHTCCTTYLVRIMRDPTHSRGPVAAHIRQHIHAALVRHARCSASTCACVQMERDSQRRALTTPPRTPPRSATAHASSNPARTLRTYTQSIGTGM